MTGLAWLALAVTAVLALAEWFAVAASRRGLEYVAKPAVMVGLIAFAILLHPADSIERTFFVVALTFGLISDIFLMLPRDMFLLGLVAALVEHLAYIAGFNHRPHQAALLAVAAVIALVSVAVILPPVIRALRKNQPALVWPVVAIRARMFTFLAPRAAPISPRRPGWSETEIVSCFARGIYPTS